MLLFWATTSCVSTRKFQALEQEKATLKSQVGRLKAQNEELINERFSYNSIIESKNDQVNKVAQKYQAEAVIVQQKYDQLQQDYASMNEELRQKTKETEILQQKMLATQQVGTKQAEELQTKLKWAYGKLYGGRRK
ncbi:MAG: hypothetical protein EAZ32_04940 [Cytophagia bacterium]|nr:MAG: hypothetical protein EAZ38_07360 [Cytophagales bacterium]TAG40908.1 MAG: hypothetical protein EAZ32_04940 [Cytophagia bacterium]TAG55401.1 MAG: hypothetical protein EAZ29_03825 [Runella slithyformis]TAG82557.1 MAG: hypothetical protein EAZ22_05000 [Cytophagales bacterium]